VRCLCLPSQPYPLNISLHRVSNSFLFLLRFFMLFPLIFQSTVNELQPAHCGERRYSCIECGGSFSGKSNLKKHLRIHSGERPFSSDVCNKSFSQRIYLKRHKLIHNGERPFAVRQDYLKTHKRIHSGERPFSCNVCNKLFSQQGHLKRHQLTHSDVQ
jgi:KRAB domain-containing zinc finger protein